MIRRIKQLSSVETGKLTYYSAFHCQMLYGIIICGQNTCIEKVLLKQKRAIRTLFGLKQTEGSRGGPKSCTRVNLTDHSKISKIVEGQDSIPEELQLPVHI